MRAITYERYGGPEVLAARDLPDPSPGPRDVLIRVRAAEATKTDCEMRSLDYSVDWLEVPMRVVLGVRRPRRRVLGMYFAGEVEAVGSKVTRFAPGDKICGGTGLRLGAYAEYLVLPERSPIGPKPATMTFVEAAAVPLGGFNALHFMRRARLEPGHRILIVGAGGSIGAHAVQIARSMGAEVTAVDHGRKAEFLRRLGAAHVVDYTSTDVAAFAVDTAPYDAVFDMIPSSPVNRLRSALRPGGRYLAGNPSLRLLARSAVAGRRGGTSIVTAFADEKPEALAELADLIETGRIGPIVDRVHPLEEVAEAHRRLEAEERLGADVLAIGDPDLAHRT